MVKTLCICPHNDDESLFAAYIIQLYKPLVVILTSSYIQYERGELQCSATAREAESIAAMKILGAEVGFARIPDKNFNAELCEAALLPYAKINYDIVFSPMPDEGGNWMHDVTGQVADKLFLDASRHYSTYTKDREYPAGPIMIAATEEMKVKKLAAIDCYNSQKTNVCKMYLEAKSKDEFLCN